MLICWFFMVSELKLEEIWNPYNSIMLNGRHKELCTKAYEKFPRKLKKKIFKHHLIICDYFYHSKYPDKIIDGMPYGFYHVGRGMIDIIPEEAKKLSDDAFMGFIVHETAHFYFDKTSFLWKRLLKWVFKLKFNSLSLEHQKFYREPEEIYAEWQAIKWGFYEETLKLNKERVIIKQKE